MPVLGFYQKMVWCYDKGIKGAAMKTQIFILIFALFMSLPTHAVASGYDHNRVINLAGKQRMLTQKMTKEALLIALDIDAQINLKNLKSSYDLFDKTLKGLRDGDSELGLSETVQPNILNGLNQVDVLWFEFSKTIQEIVQRKTVSSTDIEMMADKNLPLLWAMNDVVKLYEIDAAKTIFNPKLAIAINLSGRQRMLIQKMTKEYLLIHKGYDPEENKKNLKNSMALFDLTLDGLIHGNQDMQLVPAPSGEIEDQLKIVERLWREMRKQLMSDEPATRQALHDLAINNVLLLHEMNKAVGMYEAIR